MDGKKDGYHDRMESVSRDLRRVSDRLDDNRRSARSVEEAQGLTQQICHDQRVLLEEVSHCWKGSRASQLIGEAYDASEAEFQQAMTALDERQADLAQEKRALLSEEESLRGKSASLTREKSKKEGSSWD